MNTETYHRFLTKRIDEAMQDTPAVLISGPRQAGKTTLARRIAGQKMRYLTLDDETVLLAAKEDPVALVRDADRVVIDEIQRAPGLLIAIKKSIDEDRRPGRFLLTGSVNLMTLPTVADSLAGRMETVTLLPLSQAEICGSTVNWLDSVFAGTIPVVDSCMVGSDLEEIVLRGGYPESVLRSTHRRRAAWARQYLNALLQRDVRDIASVGNLDLFPRLVRVLAEMSGQMCNYSQLGGQLGLDHKTTARYVGILEQMFLLTRVEAWSRSRIGGLVKTPKLHFLDSGLLSTLLGLTPLAGLPGRNRFGHVLETFVHAELLKHAATTDNEYRMFHYRDRAKYEVDVVIENAQGQLVGVEVKAAASVNERDLRGIRRFAEAAGDKMRLGVILYDGAETFSLGPDLLAAPLSTLWGR
ncbi:ATP-binding protein [Desulfomicrobium sp. ZS1]|uniref:ATP-binding protein n=1 Tax=Desulfomicrobium sp. ZS1 TaxID=2952228 RepID=UPI0035315C29